jgi:hypothetical protein
MTEYRQDGMFLIDNEVKALYLLLKKDVDILDLNQIVILNKIEKYLYSKLSIQAFEKIETDYDKKN